MSERQVVLDRLSGITMEEFTQLFPDWRVIRDTHILSGMSVEQSWAWFVEELVKQTKKEKK